MSCFLQECIDPAYNSKTRNIAFRIFANMVEFHIPRICKYRMLDSVHSKMWNCWGPQIKHKQNLVSLIIDTWWVMDSVHSESGNRNRGSEVRGAEFRVLKFVLQNSVQYMLFLKWDLFIAILDMRRSSIFRISGMKGFQVPCVWKEGAPASARSTIGIADSLNLTTWNPWFHLVEHAKENFLNGRKVGTPDSVCLETRSLCFGGLQG